MSKTTTTLLTQHAQTIEAGIKEGNNVFQRHHLKVRSEAALFLQEYFAVFAANLVRRAAHWLVTESTVQKLHFCAQLTILVSLLSPCPCTMAISFLKLKSSSSPL